MFVTKPCTSSQERLSVATLLLPVAARQFMEACRTSSRGGLLCFQGKAKANATPGMQTWLIAAKPEHAVCTRTASGGTMMADIGAFKVFQTRAGFPPRASEN